MSELRMSVSTDYLVHPGQTMTVLGDVADERARQDRKWGEQNHPNGTGPVVEPLNASTISTPCWCYLDAAELAQEAREDCQRAFAEDRGTYRHVLMEELFEALAENDPRLLRAELVQVAAVAVAWVEAIDRRQQP